MRKRRLWWRLFISYLWVPVVVLLSIGWYGSDVVWELYENHLDSDLEARARLCGKPIGELLTRGQSRRSRCALQGIGPVEQHADHRGASLGQGDRRLRRDPARHGQPRRSPGNPRSPWRQGRTLAALQFHRAGRSHLCGRSPDARRLADRGRAHVSSRHRLDSHAWASSAIESLLPP